MCQYDTDAPAQGHPHPHAGILQMTIFYDYITWV